MKNKDYGILLREYEKLNADRPDIYIMSFEEQTARLERNFKKYPEINLPGLKNTAVKIEWLRDGDALMKYYNAFRLHDMQMLNDVLFETAHLMQMGDINSPDTDYSFHGLRITPNLMAADMMERIELLLPETDSIFKNTFVGAAVAGLIIAILYDNPELKIKALERAEKQLGKKNTRYYVLYIECMRAILLKDYAEFNEKINMLCKAHMRVSDFGMNGFNKRFCIDAHGMYNFAKYAFGGIMRDDIVLPAADNFCQEFAVWQEENGFRCGKQIYIYPETLEFYNRLMNARPVKMYLKTKGRNNVLDTDRYLEDISSVNNL